MEKFSGFMEGQYHFVVYVPTTIFDTKVGKIEAYTRNLTNEKLITYSCFRLKDMPRWDVSSQSILLSDRDMSTLEKVTSKLIKNLKIEE